MNRITPPISRSILLDLAKYFRKMMRANSVFHNIYYKCRIDDLSVWLNSKGYVKAQNDALSMFLNQTEISDENLIRFLKRDMKHCYYLIKANPKEYFLLGLRGKTDKERKEYVTDKFLFMTMGNIIPRKKHDEEIEDKIRFYQIAKKYFRRKALAITPSTDLCSFKEFAMSAHDIILKPNTSCMGHGIEVVNVATEQQAVELFDRLLRNGGTWIAEEVIKQSDEMAKWNQSSCNTVRYLSFKCKDGFHVITPFFRTGRKGSVVDNAGQGGVFANIDAETGVICTDGVDELGKTYERHPDSGLIFKGWQIPRWKELVSIIRQMHAEVMPEHPYIGWDMALTDDGWVVIESNWGEFINQFADHIGRRDEFLRYIANFK